MSYRLRSTLVVLLLSTALFCAPNDTFAVSQVGNQQANEDAPKEGPKDAGPKPKVEKHSGADWRPISIAWKAPTPERKPLLLILPGGEPESVLEEA